MKDAFIPFSRMAPTPSGFLHLGNALNFILARLFVYRQVGKLHLRIDDMDGIRTRKEVIEDIFYSLDWLGLNWDTGPSGPEDFYARFSLMNRMDSYGKAVDTLLENKLAYACDCSRKSLAAQGIMGAYPGLCRNKGLYSETMKTSIRLQVPENTKINMGLRTQALAEDFGDFVLWRKENLAAYHLASVLEDDAMGINLVVRGADLLPSTAAQLFLAQTLGLQNFPAAFFIHHGLVAGKKGEKLSKSRGSHALCEMRESGISPAGIFSFAADFLHLETKDKIQDIETLQRIFNDCPEKHPLLQGQGFLEISI
ncbi:glutamate--tRNA ligase family protein [Desulfobotulus mexicanus]|uniref:tRNA glutamyl-Q synthetase n=1 Tax=Desulfobotulus mexicanus TaxID=2586642 RepID=A0A5S5MCA0_9BACT|nr:glutamate--tRNA ligase family protein [Desulfobotulus mexicanus]TYT73279.1 tRNA glutamyl-Q synthetase [Desulfobotulus mexicanus]